MDLNDYEGEWNVLLPLLHWELVQALENVSMAKWDGNCDLDLESPNGTKFQIFVDCGDFDYFDHAELPGGTKLDFGDPALRQLEWLWSKQEEALFRELISIPRYGK